MDSKAGQPLRPNFPTCDEQNLWARVFLRTVDQLCKVRDSLKLHTTPTRETLKLLGRLEMLVKERRTATPERVKAIQREITGLIHEMLVIDANLN
jgi:hypothetical protein